MSAHREKHTTQNGPVKPKPDVESFPMHIAIVDADYYRQNRFPNLACLKLSGYHKGLGNSVTFLQDYSRQKNFDQVYVAKVFTDSKVPELEKNVIIGGTGFFYDKSPKLEKEVEHSMPDYSFYPDQSKYFKEYSIGWLTRGCPRRCSFCVNRNSSGTTLASPIKEFFEPTRPKLCLLDDNIFAYPRWRDVFSELKNFRFEFKQGLDIRLLDDARGKALKESRLLGHLIFAFDDIKDYLVISEKLKILRRWTQHQSKAYLLAGFPEAGPKNILTVFQRLELLWRFNVLGYFMPYQSVYSVPEPYRSIYTQLGRWCNMPQFQWKLSFKEFCLSQYQKAADNFKKFESKHRDMGRWLNMRYSERSGAFRMFD